MQKKFKIILIAVLVLWFLGLLCWYLRNSSFPILDPKGVIASEQRQLIFLTVGLAMIVIIPVYIMLFAFAWRYREGNTKAKYQPELSGNVYAELVWWGIPAAIILTLSLITWHTSHSMDPHKSLAKHGQTSMHIQVIALDWKWLFIYPDQHIASVNFVQIPVNQPVTFDVTSDAPMNSFWIPQLGGQIYAMTGMSTQLNEEATQTGDYQGSSANISGKGFAGMTFTVRASSAQDFNDWVSFVKKTPNRLDQTVYDNLAKPSENNPQSVYSFADSNIYDTVLLKYMAPGKS